MIESLKEERKAAWKIAGRRASLTRRTERTNVLVSPVGLGKCEKRRADEPEAGTDQVLTSGSWMGLWIFF